MSANVWVWVGLSWTDRIRLVLDNYGDRITDVSIFGWRVNASGTLTQTFDPVQLETYRAKWPHIRWWGCFRNMEDPTDSARFIFDSLRDSATARNHLADQVEEKMFGLYPWLHGVDIDMELGGDTRSAESEEVFRVVTNRAHSLGKKASGALPGLTATGSVGGENWVRYKQLGEILDHASIMSYDFAWNGSAPGPISPAFWLEDVYVWASSQIPPEKLSMGLPLYGRFWQIYDYPSNLGELRRGASGSYYSIWQYFAGERPWSDSGSHHAIGWLAYRDPGSKSAWGFLDVYDWREPNDWATSSGVVSGVFQNRNYAVRYGQPAGAPQWSVTDNSAGSSLVTYDIVPEAVIASNGNQVSPKVGYTLTTEIIQREPVAATIIDDYATSWQQLGNIYTQPSGNWDFKQVSTSYKQYRGAGTLRFNHDFGTQSLYSLARFQFASGGTFRVSSQGMTAELSSNGELRLLKGSTVLDSTNVGAQVVGAAAQVGRCVLAIRVREGSTRVYFSNAETNIPLRLEASTTPPGGPTEFVATGQTWIDHIYLGDGWWYQPREAIEVELGGQTRVVGRISRTGVTWDSQNRFRVDSDVEEHTTRTTGISPDWAFDHWKDAPFTTGQAHALKIKPLDHDLWLGRIVVGDRDGFSLVYWSDAETIAHWRDRALFDYNLQGIAMWSLGQEDVRMWETFEGGELPTTTKRVSE